MGITKMAAPLGIAAVCWACGDEAHGPGRVRIQLAAEETITDGLTRGVGEESTEDCDVSYSKYLVAIGRVQLTRTAPPATRTLDAVYIADMIRVGEQGLTLGELDDLATGQWDQFSFETPVAGPEAQALPGVLPEDERAMKEGGLTYWVEGRVSCPEKAVGFSFQVASPVRYESCQNDGEPGIAISEGGTSTASITLHGDHLWFDSLSVGGEGSVRRRAAWILAADADGDGTVVTSELVSARADTLFTSAAGYNLSGANIANAFDFVKAQLGTQGHLNGEGDCVPVGL